MVKVEDKEINIKEDNILDPEVEDFAGKNFSLSDFKLYNHAQVKKVNFNYYITVSPVQNRI